MTLTHHELVVDHPPSEPQPSRGALFIASLGAIDVLPAIALAIYGGTWITVHATAGRGFTHTVFQYLALAENVVALLLVRRKPLASLVGILLVYLVVDLEPTTLPAAMFALAVVAALADPRGIVIGCAASGAAVVWMPFLHGDPVSATSVSWHVAIVCAAVSAGLYVKSRRARTTAAQAEAGHTSSPFARPRI